MTLDLESAIKHCEEVAETNESQSKWLIYKIQNTEYNEYYKKKYQSCIKHASEHRQLAEWLKELKEYRKNYTCFNCYNSSASFSDYPCCECRRCFKALDGIKDHYEEANADE